MNGFEEEEYNNPFNMGIWKKMYPFLKPFKKRFILVVLLMSVSAVIDIVLPLFQKVVIDDYIMPGTTEGIFPFAALFTAVVLLQGLSVVLFVRLAMNIEMYFGRDLKKAAFEKLQKLSVSFYNVTPVGYLLARVMSDTNRIGMMVAWGLVDLMWAFGYIIGVSISMMILNVKLALLIMTVTPFIVVVTGWFRKRMLIQNRRVRRTNSRITGAFNEGITGAKTSKLLVIEDKNSEDFSKLTDEMYKHSIRSSLLSAIFMPIILFFGAIVTAAVITEGGGLVREMVIPFGTLSVFISYAVGIFEPIQQLARVFTDFVSTQANIERVVGLLERDSEIRDRPEVVEKYGDNFYPKKENWEPIVGDIEFKDVTFMYPDGNENVLEHFSLKVPAGTTVAIVGETGAGKSTLVNLVCRFFEPNEGEILIDGRDYRERSQLWLHSSMGYVLQNPHLFSGSIRENIRFGRLDATDEEIEEAAKIVAADRIINGFEKGYDSNVGEGGDRLSTGEKQLVSFARAVLADPRIFIFDEATSSVDAETESLIHKATAHMLEGRTSFLIAHRLSTTRLADIIIVMKDGKIVERGRHSELLGAKGYYYELYTRQFEDEATKVVFDDVSNNINSTDSDGNGDV